MADDYLKAVTKTIDISVQVSKLTKEVFHELLKNFAEGKASAKGKISLKELEKSSGGKKLENIEITESNIKDFRSTAAKYDIDYALKRDSTTTPPTYHVFFQTSKAENFKKAFNEYVSRKQNELGAEKEIDVRGEIRQKAQEIASLPKVSIDKRRELKKEEVL